MGTKYGPKLAASWALASALSSPIGSDHPSPLVPWCRLPPPQGSVPSPGPKGKETGSGRKHWGDPSVLANLFPAVGGFPGLNSRKLWDGTPHPGKAGRGECAGEGSPLHLTPTAARQTEPKGLWPGCSLRDHF